MIPLLRVVSVAAVAALVLGLSTTGSARPGGGNRIVLRAPGDSGAAAGSVVLRLRAGHRGELMRLRVRGLEGSSEYLVRDRVGGESLRSFRTSPAGAGRLRLVNSSRDSFSGMMIEIVGPGEGAVVLEGEDPIPDMHADGACNPPERAGHDGQDADHHASDADHHCGSSDHHGEAGADHHGAGDHGSGEDMHGGDSMHRGGGHM